jgi:hypothetical protein
MGTYMEEKTLSLGKGITLICSKCSMANTNLMNQNQLYNMNNKY